MSFEKSPKSSGEVDPETDKIGTQVVDAIYQVHLHLGPGLLESAYEACLVKELSDKGLKVDQQVPVPLEYKGIRLNVGFRLDLLVENRVIVEIKATEQLLPVYRAQVITYLKLTKHELGYLINFNAPIMKRGLERIALSKGKKEK